MIVAGISFNYHDSALSIVSENEILFADHEERYSRFKFDPKFPVNCLLASTKVVDWNQVDAIIFYEKPIIKFERQLFSLLNSSFTQSNSFVKNISSLKKHFQTRQKFISNEVKKITGRDKIEVLYSSHHLSHAASSFYTSPFGKSLILVMDAVGEWESSSAWYGENSKLTKLWSQNFPHSIGLFYSAMTQYLGLKVNSGEYKLMGLAPYGKPLYLNELSKLIQLHVDPLVGIKLNLEYFDFISGQQMVSNKVPKLFKMPVRKANEPITKFHADVAASVQAVLESTVLNLIKSLESTFGKFDNICLAGGVALNCVMNTKVSDYFKGNLWIFPAAGDAGGSTGAAVAYLSHLFPRNKNRWDLKNSLLGNDFTQDEVHATLDELGANYIKVEAPEAANFIARKISQGSVVGIFEGRSEFGPRALGNRSIVADPRIPFGQIYINEKIKFRESFRPFAPICLEEFVDEFFENSDNDEFMLKVRNVRNYSLLSDPKVDAETYSHEPISIREKLKHLNSPIPSVTHLDGSARVQTIKNSDKRFIKDVLVSFHELTKCPVLINTSHNVRGEPIVGSPTDALRCLATTGIDILFMEGFIIEKENQSIEFLSKFSLAVSDD